MSDFKKHLPMPRNIYSKREVHVPTDNDKYASPSSSRKQCFDTCMDTTIASAPVHKKPILPQGFICNEDHTMPSASSSTEIRIESADTAVKEIQADRSEVQQIIANYGVDPVELLHMVERWTQTLLAEFCSPSSNSHFQRVLREKWEKQQLGINLDSHNRKRTFYQHVQYLEQSITTCLSKKSFDELKAFANKIDQNTDVDGLKKTINDLIEKFLKLVESLEFIEQYQTGGNATNYAGIKSILERLNELNNKRSHAICIIGLEKCGKSTYINALLGFELLPTASERCTQIRTVLKPPLQENLSLFAIIEYYDDNEFQNLMQRMVEKSGEQDQQFQSRKTDVMAKRQQLVSNLSEMRESFTVNGNDKDANKKRSDIIEQLRKYIIDEEYVNIIKEISIYTDKLPGKNYELFDVPGFDSPIKEHRDAGLKAIRMADAFLFLTDGGRPSLTRDQIGLLEEIQDGKHYEAMKRAFGIITKLDHCHTKGQYDERLKKARDELCYRKFKESHIFAVCSVINLRDQNSDEYQAIINRIKPFDNLQNGFQQSKEALNQFIELELPKTHLNQLIDLGLTKLTRYVNESRSNTKNLLPSNVNITDEGSIAVCVKQEQDQEWNGVYGDKLFKPAFDKANEWQKTVLVKQRVQFIKEIKKKFHDYFIDLTKEFMNRPIEIYQLMMKRYGYTPTPSTSQPIDDQLRENLSFELEECVSRTANILTRHLYDEYVSELEKILNGISPEEHDDLYRTQLTYDICKCEIRTVLLRTCRPIIVATLRFSHSDQKCRREAVDELILLLPTFACQFCENSNNTDQSIAATITSWAPTLKKGIEMALGVYGTTGIQNRITAEVFKRMLNRFT